MTEKDLIAACKKKDRKAQKLLYDRYSPLFFSICRRYVKRKEDAEDVLEGAFFKILTNIHQFQEKGSFEGWMKRVVINESLMFLRKSHNFYLTVELDQTDKPTKMNVEDEMIAEELLQILNFLPTGYRTVFNLYVLEGYKHREIAELLGISINTSKSQLILAKKKLQHLLVQQQYPGVG